tara:strand:- start:1384 stop:1992 length:609 start_codon:yes stop_codon:yes gene_type:complete
MANITVSSDVDTMLQSANNAGIRSNIGAIRLTDVESNDLTLYGTLEVENELIINGDFSTSGGTTAEFNGQVNFESTTNFQDDMEVSNIEVTGEATFDDSVTVSGSFECEDETIFAGFSCDGDVSITGGNLSVSGPIEIEDDSNFTFSGSGNLNMQGGKIQGPDLIKLSSTSQPSSPQNGMIIYNGSAGKFQGYANGAWVDLH